MVDYVKTQRKPVVIEFGSAYIKVGFAGEHCPRHILATPTVTLHGLSPSASSSSSSSSSSSPPPPSPSPSPSSVLSSLLPSRSSPSVSPLFNRFLPASLLPALVHPLESFLFHLYFKLLLVNPKDRKVVLVEDHDAPEHFKLALSYVLFAKLHVPSILFLENHNAVVLATNSFVVPPAPSAATAAAKPTRPTLDANATALLVDVGFSKTAVMPVVHGVPVTGAYAVTNLGSRLVEARLRALLRKQSPSLDFHDAASPWYVSPATLEDIQVRACVIRPSATFEPPSSATPTLVYPLPTSMMPLELSFATRTVPYEPLFSTPDRADADADDANTANCPETSIVFLVLEALLQSPLDARAKLAENILLYGGLAAKEGFRSRFASELLSLVSSSARFESLKPLLSASASHGEFAFANPVFPEISLAWVGGSIVGSLDVLDERSLTKEAFILSGKVPTWVDAGSQSAPLLEGVTVVTTKTV